MHRKTGMWKRLAQVVPVAGLMLMNLGWSNALKAPEANLAESGRLTRKFDEISQRTGQFQINLDLSDERDWKFLQGRLRSAGKDAKNSPELFRRLDAGRERALARQGVANQVETERAWCNHFLKYSQPHVATNNGYTTFFPVVEVVCKDGADYIYADLFNYDVNEDETQTVLVSSDAGEEYGGGMGFDDVKAPATIATGKGRTLRMESLVMAMGPNIDQTSYIVERAAALNAPTTLTFTHPRKVLEQASRAEIVACQLRGGADCDYAVAGYQNGTLAPYPPSPTGVAASYSNQPGVLNASDFWAFNAPYNYQNLYVPVRGTLSAGAEGGFQCVVAQIDRARVQLIAAQTGRTCLNETFFANSIPIGGNQSYINVLTNVNWLFNLPGQGSGTSPDSCAAETIINELTRFNIHVAGKVRCNTKVKSFFVTYPMPTTGVTPNIYFWNSCMAEGTQVKLADGTLAPVESVKLGDKVIADAKGTVLTVTDVARGNEAKPLFRLRDSVGHDVTLTEMHPVIMSTGKVVAAKNLKVKDQVRTVKGVSTLTSITPVSPDKMRVYNLRLGTDPELLAVGKNGRTLYAGGFLVGDMTMQDELQAPKREPQVSLLNRLPKAWHTDFRNGVRSTQSR
ncbi:MULTISPECIES: Hint domain-containing protein [Myxococcus]|nr:MULTISPECIES: Hint domain-containing protein [Myxococcus]QZZ53884.1 hypothetical protein MyxoNM_32140 [Myxococcus xanthus]UYI13543.1 Hint domain-containing protein [Myxococcus xanthus]UYI20910.1 Hint domain-containing protein [Myxococcus xanthus]SDY24548.1 hypothetical protein SAMN05444383_12722 [Myxococcus xanthus]